MFEHLAHAVRQHTISVITYAHGHTSGHLPFGLIGLLRRLFELLRGDLQTLLGTLQVLFDQLNATIQRGHLTFGLQSTQYALITAQVLYPQQLADNQRCVRVVVCECIVLRRKQAHIALPSANSRSIGILVASVQRTQPPIRH